MAEWFKAAVLKTVERKLRGFESYFLRHFSYTAAPPRPRAQHMVGEMTERPMVLAC
jgi:hypothetical protein